MTVYPEQPRIFVVRRDGRLLLELEPHRERSQYLVSVWPDLVTVAHREEPWHTWSPPVTCEEEK